jgi:hypothetical protein
MIGYIFAFFKSKHKMTMHLLRKQKEINDLRKEIEELEKDKAKVRNTFKLIHTSIKENYDGFYWF